MKLILSIEVDWTSTGRNFFIDMNDDIEGGYRERSRVYSMDQAFTKGRLELEQVMTFINKITEQKLKPLE